MGHLGENVVTRGMNDEVKIVQEVIGGHMLQGKSLVLGTSMVNMMVEVVDILAMFIRKKCYRDLVVILENDGPICKNAN